ncbi:DUF6412 domain-containing protein [Actinomadura sp. ATCC 31491]|uniref:DUF6412 domain-containing protein n=1 Tax=Actinomadura luzonensis TaxID=2805427 RepID=A0ABT0FQ00_9ACTN|nr:DUF6412 domain-containing protein [Actinomadura luzonensis]MCK2214399.1 DUF6412 domain-containing protein [Actinomadura luzonensis]
MTQFLFDPWLVGITMVAILLLATWAAALRPVLGGEPAGFPLVYARRTAFQRQRDPDAAGRCRSRAP